MNKWIIKNITNPLWEWGAGRKRLKYLKDLERSQFFSLNELENLQNERLRSLVRHAYDNVPYYNELFKVNMIRPSDIKTKKDLIKIPILTKELIADNFEKLKAKNFNDFKPKLYSTGGTSGRHLQFYNTSKVFDSHMAAAYRGWRWSGWDFGEKYAYIWGASIDLKNENTFKKKIKNFFTENRLLIQALSFNEESLKIDIKRLIDFGSCFIISYPSSLVVIVNYMKKHNLKFKAKGIITSSEKLFSWQRKLIESFFECKIYDDYGNRESSIRATQCRECEGYHISVENGIIETVKGGKQVVEEPGKMLLTEFNNYAFPLIRYENSDVATLSRKKCKCGVSLPMIENIEGRISDIFVSPDGNYIPAQCIMVAFLDFTGEFYQVIQDRKEEIMIRIVKGKYFDKENLDNIKKELVKWFGNKIKINFKFVDKIELTAQGKRRYFISNVNKEF